MPSQADMAEAGGGQPPRLSVVVPTLGRTTLTAALHSLLRADGADHCEVLVVGAIPPGPVLDEVQRLGATHPRLRLLPVSFPSGDSSRKKNTGTEQARAPLVAYVDDDVVVGPDWPRRIVEPFDNPAVGLVSGPALVPHDLPLFARLAGHALASRAAGYVAERYTGSASPPRPVKWSRLIGCNMAYRRSVIEAIGGFDPAFWPGEEMLAAHRATRAGHTLMFHPAAWVYHYPRATPPAFVRQIFNYGATRVRLVRAGVEFEPATALPALLVASLAVLWAASPFAAVARRLLVMELLAYGLADVAITALKMAETRQASDAMLLGVIPLMHLSYGVGEWVEWLRPARDLSEKPGPSGRTGS